MPHVWHSCMGLNLGGPFQRFPLSETKDAMFKNQGASVQAYICLSFHQITILYFYLKFGIHFLSLLVVSRICQTFLCIVHSLNISIFYISHQI